MNKTKKIHSKIVYHICFWSFFHIMKFYPLIHTFLALNQLFLMMLLNFTYEVIISTLTNIGEQKSQ